LKSEGFTFAEVAKPVAQVMGLPLELVWEKGRRPQAVHARGLLFFWAAKELEATMTETANRLGLTHSRLSVPSKAVLRS
jgi:hypothetical protein